MTNPRPALPSSMRSPMRATRRCCCSKSPTICWAAPKAHPPGFDSGRDLEHNENIDPSRRRLMGPDYRYFLGFRPDPLLRALLAAQQGRAGQHKGRVDPTRLHLTLCTVAETTTSDAALVARVAAALEGGLPEVPPIRLGRIHARNKGRSEEHTSELQSLIRTPYAVF